MNGFQRILFFDNTLSGHHLEYLNLIHNGISAHPDNSYIFAVPKIEWNNKKDLCKWKDLKNVEWLMLDDIECKNSQKGSLLTSCYKQSMLVREIALKVNADSIFLISLTGVIPILPLILPSKIRLSGIIYKIYLRRKISKVRLSIEKLRYKVLTKSPSVEKVFILNDPKSSQDLNKIYKTTKFLPLADPTPPKSQNVISLRKEYNIENRATVYLHFGSMDSRKGTLEILKAILLLPNEKLLDKVFIFTGKISSSISEEFYSLIEQIKQRDVKVIIEDYFCEYSHLNDLCYTCDCILIPYHFTDLSSGVLGYASVYSKPVIGPAAGLIGDLIKDNNLGICIDDITPDSLCSAISNFKAQSIRSDYANKNSPESFINSILN